MVWAVRAGEDSERNGLPTRRLVHRGTARGSRRRAGAVCACAGPHPAPSFRGEATWTPALGRVARETGVDFNILAGRIDRIKDLPYGQLTLAMQGDRVDEALAVLRQAGIEIEEITASSQENR